MRNFLVATSFLILGSTFGQQSTWYPVPSNTDVNLNCISFGGTGYGYIGGDSLTLLRSMDSGATWTPLDLSSLGVPDPQSRPIVDVHFTSNLVGYIAIGNYTGFYFTEDGGSTWETIDTGNAGFCQTEFVDHFLVDFQGEVFLGGGGCFTASLISHGYLTSFTSSEVPEDFNAGDAISGMDFNSIGQGIAVSTQGTILKSLDFGDSWTTIEHDFTDRVFTDVAFLDDQHAKITYLIPEEDNGFGIMKSLDSGETWEEDNELATFYYPHMHTIMVNDETDEVFLGGIESNSMEEGIIFEKVDDSYWIHTLEERIRDITARPGENIVTFAVGDNGAIYANLPQNELLINSHGNIPSLVVYPNPTTNVINFEWQNSPDEFMIYDSKGQLVLTRSNPLKQQSLDIGDWAHGHYSIHYIFDHQHFSSSFVLGSARGK